MTDTGAAGTGAEPAGVTLEQARAAIVADSFENAPGFVYRVYYEDTDGAGVVYHANYLRFFERARTDWLRSLGFGQRRLTRDHGILFTVASACVRYLKPALLDDELRVELYLRRRRRVAMIFAQRLVRVEDALVLCEAEFKVACIRAQTLKPCAIPPAITEELMSVR